MSGGLLLGAAATPASAQQALLAASEDGLMELLASPAPQPSTVSRVSDERIAWSLGEVDGEQATLRLEGEQRTRFEYLDDQFRPIGGGENSHLWAVRTGVALEYEAGRFTAVGEIVDARQYGIPRDQPVFTGTVNSFAVLQAKAGYRWDEVFAEDDELILGVGRTTLNLGGRRSVARNVYRNTINNFTGVDAVWASNEGDAVRAFAYLPVARLPFDRASLQHNDYQRDVESSGIRFFGVHASSADVFLPGFTGDLYLYQIDENDASDVPTRNRDFLTMGARLSKRPVRGGWHGEWESIYQTGESRRTAAATDTKDLDHRAQFHTVSAGYTFDDSSRPRVELIYDYGSGDEDRTDGKNQRFDPLYGAYVGSHGRTGLFNAFGPGNLTGPGYRLSVDAAENTRVSLLHRSFKLSQRGDNWVRAGIGDPTGASGTDVGQMLELRVLWQVVPGSWRIDFGLTQLFGGQFPSNAPNSPGNGDTTYSYVQSIWTF